MLKADKYNVQTDILLGFKSKGYDYEMKLLIEEGLIILKDSKGGEKVLFLGEQVSYTGEPVEVTQKVTESVTCKPKKSRSKKKNN